MSIGAGIGESPARESKGILVFMNATRAPAGTNPAQDEIVRLNVRGMSCASCVAAVENALEKTPGVKEASVDLIGQRADVRVESGRAAPDRVRCARGVRLRAGHVREKRQTGGRAEPMTSP